MNLKCSFKIISFIIILCLFFISCKKNDDNSSSLPSVTTIKATSVLLNTANCGGNITFDGGYLIKQKGICYSVSTNPTINDSITKEGDSSGEFTSILKKLRSQTKYYYRAYAMNEKGTSYGSILSFTTNDSTVNDIENNVYKVVQIGTQVWMAENLKTSKLSTNDEISLITDNTQWSALTSAAYSWYNNDKGTFKEIYGALYNWYTVNSGKLCPAGWHVPIDADWVFMDNYLIANGYNYDGSTTGNKYAKAISSTIGWAHSDESGAVGNTDYPSKRNATHFTAFPGGIRESNGEFDDIGRIGFWWSSSEIDNKTSYLRCIVSNYNYVSKTNRNKNCGLSVRCVKD